MFETDAFSRLTDNTANVNSSCKPWPGSEGKAVKTMGYLGPSCGYGRGLWRWWYSPSTLLRHHKSFSQPQLSKFLVCFLALSYLVLKYLSSGSRVQNDTEATWRKGYHILHEWKQHHCGTIESRKKNLKNRQTPMENSRPGHTCQLLQLPQLPPLSPWPN